MKNLRRKLVAYCCIAILLSTFLSTKSAFAATTQVSGCPIVDLGKKVPVVLVHGFNGGPSIWDNALGTDKQSMRRALSKVQGIYITTPLFDYSKYSLDWVDYPDIGPALAQHIDDLAQASRCTGGPGKVIIVAHSMGGLATRFAAHVVLPGGRKVSDDIGLVVTIGTPNLGNLVANGGTAIIDAVCSVPGLVINFVGHLLGASPDLCSNILPAMRAMRMGLGTKLASLPFLPDNIPVMVIAGDVHTYLPVLNDNRITLSNSDTLVPVLSAIAGNGKDASKGGGALIVSCKAVIPFFYWSDGSCAHGNLPSNPIVQAQVVKSIKLYLDSQQPKSTPTNQSCGTVNLADGTYSVSAEGVSCNEANKFAAAFADDGILSSEQQQLRNQYPCKYRPEVTHRAVCSDVAATITIG